MEQKLVSIGMPTYYREYKGNYIKEALDSLIGQTYRNFELIISDNASEHRADICREYAEKDKRIKYVRQEKNIGEMRNYNFVLDQAKGEYFMWACDDDIWDSHYVEECVKKLEENPNAAAAFPKYALFDDRIGKKLEFNPADDFPAGQNPILYERLKSYIVTPWINSKGALAFGLWRRELLAGNRKGDYLGSDMSFTYRGLAKGRYAYIDKTLFLKRMDFKTVQPPWIGIRILKSLSFRLKALFSSLFYNFFADTFRIKELTAWQKIKLSLWNLFVITRLFWRREI